jgi:hypothetical protein
MKISITEFQSSNVEWCEYDAATAGLKVKFKSGGIYVYKDLHKPAVHELLATAIEGGSLGSFISNNIKPHFDCEKVEPQP